MSFRRLSLLLALPTVVGLSLAACGTEDDAAPGPSSGGSGPTAGNGGSDETGGTGGNGASGGTEPAGGMGGSDEPGPGPGGAGGDSAGGAGGDSAGGAGGDGPGAGGEGGAAPVVCHNILQAFDTDPGGSMGKYLTPSTGPVQSSTVEWNSDEGVIAKGAGKLNATFGALSEQAQLSIYFPSGTKWATCNTKMHAKVKVLSTGADLSYLNGISLSINSGNATSGRYSSQFVSTATWMMDTWYELELPFATANYQNPANTLPDFNDVNSMGVMLQTKSTGTTPVPTTLYVDDVWVE